MSSVVVRSPLGAARPPRHWSLRRLRLPVLRRRTARGAFVAVLHAADIPPT